MITFNGIKMEGMQEIKLKSTADSAQTESSSNLCSLAIRHQRKGL